MYALIWGEQYIRHSRVRWCFSLWFHISTVRTRIIARAFSMHGGILLFCMCWCMYVLVCVGVFSFVCVGIFLFVYVNIPSRSLSRNVWRQQVQDEQ